MLISDSELTIAETAQRFGYDNPSKFSAAFRDIMGMTPQNTEKDRIILMGKDKNGPSAGF